MKIAFIDKRNIQLSVENKSLKVDDKKIPIKLIDTVVISTSCSLESKDILKITKEGVSIVVVSSRINDSAIINSSKISKNSQIKMQQFQAQKRALEIAKDFLTKKVERGAIHLSRHNISLDISKSLDSIQRARSIERLLGIEGSFSKNYFKHYFKLFPKNTNLGKRSKQPPLDPANAMMSFSYMMIYNLIIIYLLSAGFEPTIGFLHKPFRSHNALSSDFMELFRADIDEFVLGLFREKKLKVSDFTKKNGVYLKYETRRRVWQDFKRFHQRLHPKIEKEITLFKKTIKE
jgi:CRISPR-associated protein Cas1